MAESGTTGTQQMVLVTELQAIISEESPNRNEGGRQWQRRSGTS